MLKFVPKGIDARHGVTLNDFGGTLCWLRHQRFSPHHRPDAYHQVSVLPKFVRYFILPPGVQSTLPSI